MFAVRRRLLGRLAALGYARCAESEFSVLAGGQTLCPERISHKLYRYVLPAGTRDVQIISSTAVPAGLDLAASDCRSLGARIGAVFVNEAYIDLDSPTLAAGFHATERREAELWRWTNGRARLALPPSDGPAVLELLVRDVMAGWEALPAELARAA